MDSGREVRDNVHTRIIMDNIGNTSQDRIVLDTTEAIETQKNEKIIYSSAVEEDRREFFGINVNTFKDQEFMLKDKSEVIRFNELLENYVYEEIRISFSAINLPAWSDKCMILPKGGRLFAALFDLKITVAFLFIDSIKAAPDGDSINRRDDIDILSNPVLFKKKLKMLHENIDLVMRYRAFYDKFMGILVLAFCPDEYDSFVKADSRKKEFGKRMVGHLDSSDIKSLNASISRLDDTFRTPEVHQTGRMRKWVLSSQDLFLDNEIDLLGYMNNILNLSIGLDELIKTL